MKKDNFNLFTFLFIVVIFLAIGFFGFISWIIYSLVEWATKA